MSISCDVSDESQVQAAFGRVADVLGEPRILVNAAGVSPSARVGLLETSAEDWRRTLDVNATASFITTRAFAGRRPANGRIVNILSTASFAGFAGLGAYCASKAACLLLTKVAAVELAAMGMTVNGVAPGTIHTEMTARFQADSPADQAKAISADDARRTPLGRNGRPSDVSGAVLYLLSPAARWVTGEVITVDGGFMATGCPDYDRTGQLTREGDHNDVHA